MEDISFSIYSNNKLQKITLQDLTSNRRVLICSVVRLYQHITNTYVSRIIDQIPFYHANGIDQVYIVFSAGGIIPLARADKIFPGITAIADDNRKFVAHIKKSVDKNTQSLDDLAQFWSYQVLLNNGEIEQFYEQPTEDYLKHLVRAGLKPDPVMQKLLIAEGDKFVLQRHWGTRVEQYTNDKNLPNYEHRANNAYAFHNCTPLEFMYFNLCPNTKLNTYLLDTAKQTSV
jgi:peroxiredoxin